MRGQKSQKFDDVFYEQPHMALFWLKILGVRHIMSNYYIKGLYEFLRKTHTKKNPCHPSPLKIHYNVYLLLSEECRSMT